MIIRLLSYFGLIEGIVLEDFQGEVYYTKSFDTPFGKKAHVSPVTKVGYVNLLEDGTCTGKSSYIKKWTYMHPKKEIKK